MHTWPHTHTQIAYLHVGIYLHIGLCRVLLFICTCLSKNFKKKKSRLLFHCVVHRTLTSDPGGNEWKKGWMNEWMSERAA